MSSPATAPLTGERIAAALGEAADPVRAAHDRRDLRTPTSVEHRGVGVPATREVVRAALREHRDLDRGTTLALAQDLWQRPVHGCRLAAIEVCIARVRVLDRGDVDLGFEGAAHGEGDAESTHQEGQWHRSERCVTSSRRAP